MAVQFYSGNTAVQFYTGTLTKTAFVI